MRNYSPLTAPRVCTVLYGHAEQLSSLGFFFFTTPGGASPSGAGKR